MSSEESGEICGYYMVNDGLMVVNNGLTIVKSWL